MKKIILTERQLDRLVSSIVVNEEDTKETPEKSPEEEAQEKKNRFLEEIQGEFFRTLQQLDLCDDITFWFGSVDADENWIPTSMKTLTFRVLSTGRSGVRAKLVNSTGSTIINNNKDLVYEITKDSFIISGENVSIKLKLTGYERYVNLKDFLVFDINQNQNNCKKSIADVKARANVMAQKWSSSVDDVLKSLEYEPGLFGMNNIFFFPKGFKAMDNILNKYGLGVKKTTHQSTVVFNITKKPETKTAFKLDSNVEGVINFNNDIVVGQFYFEVPEGQEIMKGQHFEVDVYKKTANTKVFLFKTDIEILLPLESSQEELRQAQGKEPENNPKV